MELEEAKEQLLGEAIDQGDFEDDVLVLEMEIVETGMGVVRGEHLKNGDLDSKGSVLIPIENIEEGSWWEGTEPGDKRAFGFQLDTQKETLSEKVSAFFARGLEEGQPQDFIPSLPF